MAEIEYNSLEASSPNHGAVRNRWLKQTGPARALVVVLPGLNYTCDNPLLYYLSRLAVDRDADVLQLWADYTLSSFQSASKSQQAEWLREDAWALIQAGQKSRRYGKLLLAGKSIGTLTLAALYGKEKELMETPAIWLTPLFHRQEVLESALNASGPALFIGGNADPTFDAGAFKQVEALGTAQALTIAGANHSLEIPGDMPGTLEALQTVVAAMGAFLDMCLQN
jgi:pimeloyl-ACP methyl ester carboxylesterase